MENENGREDFSRTAAPKDEFEIDPEMLEIFAVEADELIGKIGANLEKLRNFPNDAEALLEIRRAAHTLKGSASIAGFKQLAQAAHRVEDLLASVSDGEAGFDKRIFESLKTSIDSFKELARDENFAQSAEKTAPIYKELEAAPTAALQNRSVVRVSLDKLDDLINLTGDLTVNRSIFEKHFAELEKQISEPSNNPRYFQESADALRLFKSNLESFFDNQQRRIKEINGRLAQLRMVSFGSLSARLLRTVRVACEQEGKFAELSFDGENLEIDTLILDCLIEPLLHLLRNAVAHGIEAPHARRLIGKPETGRISVRVSTDDSHVVVRVADDGGGVSVVALKEKAIANDSISREEAEKMSDAAAFGLMFLPGLTTAEKLTETAGRGVGLNVVKTVVERQAGAIAVRSEARHGTTFTIRLPLNSSAAQNSDVETGEITSTEPEFEAGNFSRFEEARNGVLIVDDSPSFRRAIVKPLRDAGWHCSEASDGIEALEVLRNARPLPRLILTDAEMPRMSGCEFLAALEKSEAFSRIPVIMITSRTDEEHRREAFEAGASAYLAKPFEAARLIEKINEMTGIA